MSFFGFHKKEEAKPEAKVEEPKPFDQEAYNKRINDMDNRCKDLEMQISTANKRLEELSAEYLQAPTPFMKKMKKEEAARVYQNKKMLEKSYNTMFKQYNSLRRINENVNIVESHIDSAEAMKLAVEAMKEKTKTLNVKSLADLADQYEDLQDDVDELDDVIGDMDDNTNYEDDLAFENEFNQMMFAPIQQPAQPQFQPQFQPQIQPPAFQNP